MPDFSYGAGRIHFTNRDAERGGTCTSERNTQKSWFSDMVSGVTYYVRAVLIDLNTGENFYTGEKVKSFTVPDSLISYTDLVLSRSETFGPSWEQIDARFTAGTAGLYTLCADSSGDWIEVLRADGSVEAYDGQDGDARRELKASFYASAGETVYVNGVSDSTQLTVLPAEDAVPRLLLDTPLAAASGDTLCFEAPEDGWYRFEYGNSDAQHPVHVLDSQTGEWRMDRSAQSGARSRGELVFLRPFCKDSSAGPMEVVCRKITPADENSIEVSEAYSVTNQKMTLDFTLGVTAETADEGYTLGLIWGEDPGLENGNSMTALRRLFDLYNGETLSITMENFVPGQSFYYRAFLRKGAMDPGSMAEAASQVLAMSGIRRVEFDSGLDGFREVIKDSSVPLDASGDTFLYFTAPEDGMYAVEAEGTNVNANAEEAWRTVYVTVKDSRGYPVGGKAKPDRCLLGTYVQSGDRIFIRAEMSPGMSGSLGIYDGLDRLPEAETGTQELESNVPVRFAVPEDGEYRFLSDEPGIVIRDGSGLILYTGREWQTGLKKGQLIWVESRYDPSLSLHLTIEKDALPTRILTLPASLTHLKKEAFRGTTAEEAVFGGQIRTIGSRAFADCPALRRVVIPAADVEIAEDAFLNSSVTLAAPAGSSAEKYAAEHSNVSFEALS